MNEVSTAGLAAAVAGARRAEFERQACRRSQALAGRSCEGSRG